METKVGLLIAQGQYQAAQLALEEVAHAHPRCAHTHFLLASLHLLRGRRPEAIVELRRAVFIDPTNATYLFNLAAALHATGRFAEALRFATEASKRDPKNLEAARMVQVLSKTGASLN